MGTQVNEGDEVGEVCTEIVFLEEGTTITLSTASTVNASGEGHGSHVYM